MENKIETLKERFTGDKFKLIFNVVFYALMFILLFMTLTSRQKATNVKPQNKPDYEEVTLEGFETIDKKNFEYSYSLVVDDSTYVYSGKKNSNKDIFAVTNKGQIQNYFTIDDVALIQNGDKWELAEYPIMYFNYFNTDLIEKIINASLFSKSKNRYEITTSAMLSIFDPAIRLDNKSINTINLVYTNKTISSIEMDISELAKHYDSNVTSAKLSLNYLKFGEVEPINIEK